MKRPYLFYIVLIFQFLVLQTQGQVLEVQSGASLTIGTGASVTVTGGSVANSGMITGSGSMGGAFINGVGGVIAPGGSPGCIDYASDFTNNGKLEIELDDGTACTDYDQIRVTGNAVINGTIEISFIGGTAPSTTSFTIVTATGTLTAAPTITWPTGYSGTFSIVGGNQLMVSFSLLPVELSFFRGKAMADNKVELSWRTESETDNEGFEIVRSVNGWDWEVLEFVEGRGTTLEAQTYSYMDQSPTKGINYYRLHQLDFDGKSDYSQIVSVYMGEDGASKLQVYPNPIGEGDLILNFPEELSETAALTLYSPTGQVLHQQQVSGLPEALDMTSFPAGIYLLTVTDRSQIWQERIVKR